MRLYPPVPVLARMIDEDIQIGKKQIILYVLAQTFVHIVFNLDIFNGLTL